MKKLVQPEVNIGLIGHVDAGKTALVYALTGKWTDTYSEEIKRGISIRLGYADATFYKCTKCNKYSTQEKCPYCNSSTQPSRKISFIDAPGHETLMTKMLSGAALMDGAILVISANEKCPQAQTIEHLNAIKIVGVKNIVVAQNKIDLISKERAKESFNEIKTFLKSFGYENAKIIPISANHKINVSELIEAIEEEIPSPKFDNKKPLKMYCARSFDVNKPGTKVPDLKGGVLGGTIIQGMLKKGDEIEVCPGIKQRLRTRVESIFFGNEEVENAKPGGLVAIQTLLDPSITKGDQMRGQIISKPGTLPKETNEIKLKVIFIERTLITTKKDINLNDQLVMTIGTMTVLGKVIEKKNEVIKVWTKNPVIVERDQKIALSMLENMKWRLMAYGIAL